MVLATLDKLKPNPLPKFEPHRTISLLSFVFFLVFILEVLFFNFLPDVAIKFIALFNISI